MRACLLAPINIPLPYLAFTISYLLGISSLSIWWRYYSKFHKFFLFSNFFWSKLLWTLFSQFSSLIIKFLFWKILSIHSPSSSPLSPFPLFYLSQHHLPFFRFLFLSPLLSFFLFPFKPNMHPKLYCRPRLLYPGHISMTEISTGLMSKKFLRGTLRVKRWGRAEVYGPNIAYRTTHKNRNGTTHAHPTLIF